MPNKWALPIALMVGTVLLSVPWLVVASESPEMIILCYFALLGHLASAMSADDPVENQPVDAWDGYSMTDARSE